MVNDFFATANTTDPPADAPAAVASAPWEAQAKPKRRRVVRVDLDHAAVALAQLLGQNPEDFAAIAIAERIDRMRAKLTA
jgi:hypothetical protein